MNEKLISVPIGELIPDPTQPRKHFEAEALQRLAASLTARGVLQPLRVIRDAERQCWRILTGESRYRAGGIARLTHLPCLVIEGEPEEEDILADRIVENSCRSDLRSMELARAIARLKALKGCNSRVLAEELGLSAATITRAEALLTLPPDVQQLVDDGRLAESAAYEISRLPDAQAQRELALAAEGGKLNRERVIEAVHGTVPKRNVVPRSSRLSCKLGELSITVSGAEPLTWDGLLTGLDRLRKEARKLYEGGKDITALARTLRAS
jgi:ParB family chromosome partitioning protein